MRIDQVIHGPVAQPAAGCIHPRLTPPPPPGRFDYAPAASATRANRSTPRARIHAMEIDVVAQPGAEWDEFARSRPDATLGHAAGWAHAFRAGYRLESIYLAARRTRGGEMAGILPLVAMRGLRGSLELVSLPFLDTAGVLAAEPEAANALVAHALALARERRAVGVELRGLAPVGAAPGALDRVDLILRLEGDVDAQWKSVRAKVRNQTRKAEREGLALIERGGEAQLDAFYAPFTVNMRDLGSPVHGRRFFAAVAEAFGDGLRFVVTGLDGVPVGGLVAIHYGDTVSIPWASTLRSERRRCPNNQIYWEGLRWAVERGARWLDFGRSPRDGGTHRFKAGWGGTERELDWRRLAPSGAPATGSASGGGALLQRLSRLWTHLPVSVATQLGPHVRRRLSS